MRHWLKLERFSIVSLDFRRVIDIQNDPPNFLHDGVILVEELEIIRSYISNKLDMLDFIDEQKLENIQQTNLTAYDLLGLLKYQLAMENPQSENYNVLRSVQGVRLIHPNLSNVNIPVFHHYQNVEPREPKISEINTSIRILGVTFMNSRDRLNLIDGYHRTKWAKQNNRSTGHYLLIY